MPSAPAPSLIDIVRRLSDRPSLPQSLNLQSVLLAAFITQTDYPVPCEEKAPEWSTVLDFYGAESKIFYFERPAELFSSSSPAPVTSEEKEQKSWAIFFVRPLNDSEGRFKIHFGFSDPSVTSTSRQALLTEFLEALKTTCKGLKVAFGGLPDGLVDDFEKGSESMDSEGGGKSYKVQKKAGEVASGKILSDRFEKSVVRAEEMADLLNQGIGKYPVEAFLPLVHLSSCIRDLEDPERRIVSWCFLYEDLSVAALFTLPTHRGLALASHTVRNYADNIVKAVDRLPIKLREAVPDVWVAADWNDGNPFGQMFFQGEGWELLEEAVRWTRGQV
ncbi:Acyl-CoA N-acyltransferase [Phaffia rhodozyma]|uniref:Acyl-CoA N-acyltransferase n=1 Tax=Phaffia rhodozyma TaxID=264483 RepID=A0A0F7SRV0_PHARH|nr:Acyl-CoA N-acyltransferase [Phaffia rhodozyma]